MNNRNMYSFLQEQKYLSRCIHQLFIINCNCLKNFNCIIKRTVYIDKGNTLEKLLTGELFYYSVALLMKSDKLHILFFNIFNLLKKLLAVFGKRYLLKYLSIGIAYTSKEKAITIITYLQINISMLVQN